MAGSNLGKIQLEVLGLSSHNRSDAFALVLSEISGNRRLPIVIGLPEAQSIAMRLEHVQSPRPLTHDLFFSFAMSFGVSVDEVLLYDLRDGIFYSKIICRQGNSVTEVDARTSDAVAIALRFDAPIFTYDHVLQRAGIILNEAAQSRPQPADEFDEMSVEQLTEQMNAAIAAEDYERASKIRDILQKRSSGDAEIQ